MSISKTAGAAADLLDLWRRQIHGGSTVVLGNRMEYDALDAPVLLLANVKVSALKWTYKFKPMPMASLATKKS